MADQYLKLGAATALLFGLAGMIPSPEEPVLPITLQSTSSSKVSKSGNHEEHVDNFLGPYDIGGDIYLSFSGTFKKKASNYLGLILARIAYFKSTAMLLFW